MGRLLVLASASPRRRQLLKTLKRRFIVHASGVHERTREKNPRRLVLELARRKAKDVAKGYAQALVLGADTIVVCRGEILLKPRNLADSRRILKLLNGRWQRVYTGVAVAVDGGERIFQEAVLSRVKARKLSDERLERLVGKHMDKAGAYAVQDKDDPFIEKIEGELDNVVGLPMKAVRRLLRRAESLGAFG
jgi:septum formation protein